MVFHIFVYSLNPLFTQKTPLYHYSWFSSRGPIVILSGHQTPTSTPILITSRFTNLRAVKFTAVGDTSLIKVTPHYNPLATAGHATVWDRRSGCGSPHSV